MSELMRHAAWILLITFALSVLYELYRATIKAGVSRHDSLRTFVSQGLPLYVAAAIVIAMLFAGFTWDAWVGLIFSVALILVSIFYYNPRIMLERQPGMIDWFEDLVYTGLLFVAAALLLYDVLGNTLAP
jgi:phosphatidylserine synthase